MITDIDEVNKMLESGEWELQSITKGVDKEIYLLRKYKMDKEEENRKDKIETIFTTIGKISVLIFILSIVISLKLLYKGEILIKK